MNREVLGRSLVRRTALQKQLHSPTHSSLQVSAAVFRFHPHETLCMFCSSGRRQRCRLNWVYPPAPLFGQHSVTDGPLQRRLQGRSIYTTVPVGGRTVLHGQMSCSVTPVCYIHVQHDACRRSSAHSCCQLREISVLISR